MKFLRALVGVVLLTLQTSLALAWIHGTLGPPGNAQQNLGLNDITHQTFINMFHDMGFTFAGGSTVAAFDATDFPVQNFSGDIEFTLSATDPISTTGPWVLGWDAGRSCFRVINFGGVGATVSASSNATVTNGSGSGNLTVMGNCSQAGSVTFTWANTGAGTGFFEWDGTYTQWSSNTTGRFYLVRQSDLAAWNNGQFWTPEMVSLLKSLHPESIRPMSLNAINGINETESSVANWSTRRLTSSFSFSNSQFPPSTRCGGTTSFCTISLSGSTYTAAAASGTNLSGWTDGEQIQGTIGSALSQLSVTAVGSNGGNCQYTVSSTTALSAGNPVIISGIGGATECNTNKATILTVDNSTQFTVAIAQVNSYTSGGAVGYQLLSVTGKSASPKLIVNTFGSNGSVSTGNVTFTYIALLDDVIYYPSGISNSIPIEAQVQLANLINANYWYNFPPFASLYDSFIIGASNLIYANLNSNLKFIEEDANEIWNGGFPVSDFYGALGANLFNGGGFGQFQGLRVQQINSEIRNTSNWTSALSRLETTYCFQGGNGGSFFAYAFMQGVNLAPQGVVTLPLSITAGSGYVNGTYTNVPMTGGSGSNAAATIIVSGGSVASVTFTNGGISYTQGNSLSASNTNLGGSGSGFSVTVNVGTGNSTYTGLYGSTNFGISPNRPIDVTTSICYAPYVGGGMALSGQSQDANYTPTTFDTTNLNSIISDEGSGNTSGAIALVDQSVRGTLLNRVQTVTASGTTFTTPTAHNFGVGDLVRFTVSGGTTYSGLTPVDSSNNPQSPYYVTATSTTSCPGAVTCNFTVEQVTNGALTSTINAGTAGSGTTSVGYVGHAFDNQTFPAINIFDVMSGWYTKYQNMVSNRFTPAPATAPLKVRWYEGALEPTAPSPLQLSNIGVTPANSVPFTGTLTSGSTTISGLSTTTGLVVGMTLTGTGIASNVTIASINSGASSLTVQCPSGLYVTGCPGSSSLITGNGSTSITADDAFLQVSNALLGWKNDPSSAATIQYYFNTFLGTQANVITSGVMPNSTVPANLSLMGDGQYGIVSNSSYVSPTYYQLFNGVQQFN